MRFWPAWLLASVPIFALGDVLLKSLLNEAWNHVRFLYWLPMVPWIALLAAITSRLQARVLARHAGPIRGWTWASTAGYSAAGLVFLSGDWQWQQFTGGFGAVKLPGEWFLMFYAAMLVSCGACVGAAEAWVLRGQGLGRRWPLWIVARAGLAFAFGATYWVFHRAPHPPVAVAYYCFTWWGGLCAAALWHGLNAAATAFLLFRFPVMKKEARGYT